MNTSGAVHTPETALQVLERIRQKGVRLWSEQGELRFRAPKGVLTPEDVRSLRYAKERIVAMLRESDAASESTRDEEALTRAPLSFTQLAHWNLHRLAERCAIRQIAAAVRLTGRLNVAAFADALAEVISRHDALRTRLIRTDGRPSQHIVRSMACRLQADDWRTMPRADAEGALKSAIDDLILDPIDPATGPLFGIRLVRLTDDEHVLIVAMEHSISDAISRGILLRELLTAYDALLAGRTPQLPPIRIQFPQFALRQQSLHAAWLEKHSAYWQALIARSPRLRFASRAPLENPGRGRGSVPLVVPGTLRQSLLKQSRGLRTTLVMAAFTAYAAVLLRWCNAREGTIQHYFGGRTSPDVEHTVGYFASPLYVQVSLNESDDFVTLLEHVTEQYCRAYENADFSYAASQVPRPELTRNPAFNWVPMGSKDGMSDTIGARGSLTRSVIPFQHPMLTRLDVDMEPAVLLYDQGSDISGALYFSLGEHEPKAMERFAQDYLSLLRAMASDPRQRIKDCLLQ